MKNRVVKPFSYMARCLIVADPALLVRTHSEWGLSGDFLEEFIADDVAWDALTIPTPDFGTAETTWFEDFESDWT